VLACSGFAGATDQVRPGGTYTVSVTLRKPEGMTLDKGTWEVRAYFYSGTNCFNVGEWWQPEGSTDYLYTGWWTPRYPANGAKYSEAWASPNEKTLPGLVVQILSENVSRGGNKMRPPADGESVTLRVRLRLKNIDFQKKDNYVEFRMGGKTYRPRIERQSGSTIYLERGGKLDITTDELDVDYDVPFVASAAAGATGSFSVTLDVPNWPTKAEAQLPVLTVAAGVAAVVVCAVAAAALVKRKKPAQA